MSCVEHYFENLIHDGQDIKGEYNKNNLSDEVKEAVETCYYYVLYDLFGDRESLDEFLKGGRE